MIFPPYRKLPFFIFIPEPEVLRKYGVVAVRLLHIAKSKANLKGEEHRRFLKQLRDAYIDNNIQS